MHSTSRIIRVAFVMTLGASALAQTKHEVVPGMHADEIISEYGPPKGKAIGDNGRENWLYPQFHVRLQDGAVVSVRYVNQKGGIVTPTQTESSTVSAGWYTPAGKPLDSQGTVSQLIPEGSTTASAGAPASPAARTVTTSSASTSKETGKSSGGKPPVRRVVMNDNTLRVAPATDSSEGEYWSPTSSLAAVALVCSVLLLVVRIGGRKRHHPYRGVTTLPGSSAEGVIVKRPDLARTGQK